MVLFPSKKPMLIKPDAPVLARLSVFVVSLVFTCVFALAFTPSHALAATNYSIDELSSDVHVQTDGAVHVVQRQILAFSGDNQGYIWYLHVPEAGESVKIDAIRFVPVDNGGSPAGEWQKLQMFDVRRSVQGTDPGDSASPSVRTQTTQPWYSYSIADGMVRSWFPAKDGAYLIETDYTVYHRVRAYRDIGELNWRYAHASLPVDSRDVTLRVTLPVPEGEAYQLGQDVYAWGHGPNEGGFEAASDGAIVYHLDQLHTGQYAEAHVVFPASWLTDLNQASSRVFSEVHLQSVLLEEDEWVDSYARGAHWDFQVRVLFLALAAVVILVGVICVARFGRTYRSRRALIRVACTLFITALVANLFFSESITVIFLVVAGAIVLAVSLFLPSELAADATSEAPDPQSPTTKEDA